MERGLANNILMIQSQLRAKIKYFTSFILGNQCHHK